MSAQPRIRPAHPADLARLLAIRHAAFAAHAPVAYSPHEVRTLLADVDPAELRRMIDDGQLAAALLDDEVVGCAGWLGEALRHVYVDPRHARQGVGTALLAYVEADFRRRTGAPAIVAGVALHAIGFYRANGYVPVRRAVAWDGSAYLRMRKPLGVDRQASPAGSAKTAGS